MADTDMRSIYTNAELQRLFADDRQGYLFADLLRIINGGCHECITEEHIEALRAENRAAMESMEDPRWPN